MPQPIDREPSPPLPDADVIRRKIDALAAEASLYRRLLRLVLRLESAPTIAGRAVARA